METGEQRKCRYCGWEFEERREHRRQKVLPYCSHGCRLAVQCTDPLRQNHHGASHVSVEHTPEAVLAVEPQMPELEEPAQEPEEVSKGRNIALEVVRALLDMTMIDREILIRYLLGRKHSEITQEVAHEVRQAKQIPRFAESTVTRRLSRLARQPWIRELFRQTA